MSSKKSAIIRAKERSKLLARQARMADAERQHAIRVVHSSLESVRIMLTGIIDTLALHEPMTKKDRDKTREVCKACKVSYPCSTREQLVTVADHAQTMLNAIINGPSEDAQAS